MKILITGYPGTGKSTIAKALKKLGRNAYDPQSMHAYMHVEDQGTGRHIQQPKPVPVGWYDTIGSYNWDSIKINELLDRPGDIFICSLAHNQTEFYNRFDVIFLLRLDHGLLKKRLSSRGQNGIGSAPSELHDILERKVHFENSLIEHGAVSIDASRPTGALVEQILRDASN